MYGTIKQIISNQQLQTMEEKTSLKDSPFVFCTWYTIIIQIKKVERKQIAVVVGFFLSCDFFSV